VDLALYLLGTTRAAVCSFFLPFLNACVSTGHEIEVLASTKPVLGQSDSSDSDSNSDSDSSSEGAKKLGLPKELRGLLSLLSGRGGDDKDKLIHHITRRRIRRQKKKSDGVPSDTAESDSDTNSKSQSKSCQTCGSSTTTGISTRWCAECDSHYCENCLEQVRQHTF
jgi:hypothetical protein